MVVLVDESVSLPWSSGAVPNPSAAPGGKSPQKNAPLTTTTTTTVETTTEMPTMERGGQRGD
jgi:hypothetical protein